MFITFTPSRAPEKRIVSTYSDHRFVTSQRPLPPATSNYGPARGMPAWQRSHHNARFKIFQLPILRNPICGPKQRILRVTKPQGTEHLHSAEREREKERKRQREREREREREITELFAQCGPFICHFLPSCVLATFSEALESWRCWATFLERLNPVMGER